MFLCLTIFYLESGKIDDGEPNKKKSKSNSKMDAFEATNYSPKITEQEIQLAEAELAILIDLDETNSLENCYLKTRIYQR